MRYIDLSIITKEHVYGKWEVLNRVVNSNSKSHLFSDVRIIDIKPDWYRSVNGIERTGKWVVIRDSEIIYNPQLKFFIEKEQVGNAIITRLVAERMGEGEVHKLTLYFNTGLELLLCKNDLITS